jgi:hypothetical protein
MQQTKDMRDENAAPPPAPKSDEPEHHVRRTVLSPLDNHAPPVLEYIVRGVRCAGTGATSARKGWSASPVLRESIVPKQWLTASPASPAMTGTPPTNGHYSHDPGIAWSPLVALDSSAPKTIELFSPSVHEQLCLQGAKLAPAGNTRVPAAAPAAVNASPGVLVAGSLHGDDESKMEEEDTSDDDQARKLYEAGDSRRQGRQWSAQEDKLLKATVQDVGGEGGFMDVAKWITVANRLSLGFTSMQCTQRWSKCLRPGLSKGPFSDAEDAKLQEILSSIPDKKTADWNALCASVPTGVLAGRSPKQLRERWFNNLDPSINRAPYTAAEDKTLVRQQKVKV